MSHSAITSQVAKPRPRAQAAADMSASGARTHRLADSHPSSPAALPIFLGGRGASGAPTPRFLAGESPLAGPSPDRATVDLAAARQPGPSDRGVGRIQRQCACGGSRARPGRGRSGRTA